MNTKNIERDISNTKTDIINNLALLEEKLEGVAKDVLVKQVNSHPLLMTGAFMTSGFLIGNAFFKKEEISKNKNSYSKKDFDPNPEQMWRPGNDTIQEESLHNQGWEDFKKEIKPEIKLLKQIAIGAGLNFLQKKVKNSNPQISSYLNEILGDIQKNISRQTTDAWPYSSEGSKL